MLRAMLRVMTRNVASIVARNLTLCSEHTRLCPVLSYVASNVAGNATRCASNVTSLIALQSYAMLRAILRVMLHDAPNNVASMVLQNIACIVACIVSCDDGRNVENMLRAMLRTMLGVLYDTLCKSRPNVEQNKWLSHLRIYHADRDTEKKKTAFAAFTIFIYLQIISLRKQGKRPKNTTRLRSAVYD